jgi:CHASE2 domain-containing sensor protein
MSHIEHTEHTPQKKHKKRFHSRFTKYLYERDTMLATAWVFIFIVGLGLIPLNLGFLNPIKLGLKDFDYNDIGYSKLGKSLIGNTKNDKFDSRIVIVNIGTADRELLSMVIDKVASHNPKVMALDALFFEERDNVKDSMLAATFGKHKNLIVASKLELYGDDGDSISVTGNYFKTVHNYAYANFFTDEKSTLRYFQPILADKHKKKYESFTLAIAKMYDPKSIEKLETKVNKDIIINYTRTTAQYQPVEIDKIMSDGVTDSTFLNKIVLFGYLNWLDPSNKEAYNPYDILDKKFTPLNERFAGKSIPDMDGIVAHANILSMILDKNYIKKVPSWVNLLIAFAVCWLFMSFFIHYYLESHIWFHLVAKIAQVAALILFTYLGIFLFDQYRLKVDMKMSLIVIIMAVDVIYFYEAWAVWMHKKFGYQTVFKPHHH